MVRIHALSDSDLIMGRNGRITIRGHPSGGFKGLIMIQRMSCPFCREAMQAVERLASKYASSHPVYTIDSTDPACHMAVSVWQPAGVPFFARVNRRGRVDPDEYPERFDYNNDDAFLKAIRRGT